MPPQSNIQAFQRRQKKKGGLGSVIGAVTGLSNILGPIGDASKAAGGPSAEDAIGAVGRGVFGNKADKDLAGLGKGIDTARAVGKAAGGIAVSALGIAGGSPQAAGAQATPQNLPSPKEIDAQFESAFKGIKSQPLAVRRQMSAPLIEGRIANRVANPQEFLPAPPPMAVGGQVPVGPGAQPLGGQQFQTSAGFNSSVARLGNRNGF